MSQDRSPARRQRWAAYGVITRDDQILLCRLAARITGDERWTLPGGGVDFGEHPRDALVREIHEETGLSATVGDRAAVLDGLSTFGPVDQHAVRLIFEAWVPADAPEPRVLEVDGSTAEARWHRVVDVEGGLVPMVGWALDAIAAHTPAQRQRLAAYGLARRGDAVLLTRISSRGHRPGTWTLPGGGVEHGESPARALEREFVEETGLGVEVGDLLGVHDSHFTGTAPTGRTEDFHGVHLIFACVAAAGAPSVTEVDGTTDEVAWVPIRDVEEGRVPVFDVVREAIRLR